MTEEEAEGGWEGLIERILEGYCLRRRGGEWEGRRSNAAWLSKVSCGM